jgi:phenylacetate-CoA ligase
VTKKKDLQVLNVDQITSRETQSDKLISRTTSGSTGEPFTIRRSWAEERLLGLFRLRAMRYFGQKPMDRTASVGLLRTVHPRDIQIPARILTTLGFNRTTRIDSMLPAEKIVQALKEIRPDVVTGFPGVLSLVAQKLITDPQEKIKPRFVRVNGEVLTPLMRRQINEAFDAPVYNFYASHEFRAIGFECRQTGELHTCDDSVLLEVVKDGQPVGPGERGELVGTALHSFCMPFLRFKLGDIVTKGAEACSCGLPFSTIHSVQGRMVDYFPLPGGRVIHPFEIVLVIFKEALSWLRQYHLLQLREDRILLQVVALKTPTQDQIENLKKALKEFVGAEIEFEIRLVPEIPIEPNGKFRVSRSLVRSVYDGIDWENKDPLQELGSRV